jgi:hypothetical protein
METVYGDKNVTSFVLPGNPGAMDARMLQMSTSLDWTATTYILWLDKRYRRNQRKLGGAKTTTRILALIFRW